MKELNKTNIFDTLKKYILVDGFHIAIDLQKSQGVYIADAVSGMKYLDCYSYFASLPIGHNHPKMMEPEFLEDLKWAALSNPANADIYCKEFAQSVETFGKLAKPKEFTNLFFVAGGSLAVENALKAAFDWKVQKNFEKGLATEKGHKIIHFKDAFHGRSGYTMSLTNTDPLKIKYFPKFDWPRIDNPKLYFPINKKVLQDVEEAEKKALDQIKLAIKDDGDNIAAIIIEPIQGEGGDNHFRPEFFISLRSICDENELLLIFDEVQTGLGATGKLWAYEHTTIKPDLIAFGKKAQVCGVIAGQKMQEIKTNVFNVSSRINSTWGGNLVDFVRGAQYLKIIHEDDLVQNAATVGEYFLQKLQSELYDEDKVTNIRGKGLFIAFDMKNTEARDTLRSSAWGKGLATLASGKNAVRFRPSLTFSKENVNEVIDILKKCL